MKKLLVALIAGTFAAGCAFTQPAATRTPADKASAKEEKKAAFAERFAEMQKESGTKFVTATPYKK